ncbi:glycosyltransferase family 2 protein [Mariniluteicoccus flavus]
MQDNPTTFGLNRAVGLFVVVIALAAAGMLWLGVALVGSPKGAEVRHERLFGWLGYAWDPQAPTWPALVLSIGIALALAAAVTWIEMAISRRYRRSVDAHTTPLAPQVVMDATEGVFYGEVTITVVIPAHNEEDRLGATLASLKAQDTPPDRIIVVADNCTDRTPDIAREAGAEVFVTVENTHKKAGGLNQCLRQLLPQLGENDCAMIMDADTVLEPGYLAAARRRLTDDRALMAVGGLFFGEAGGGMLGQFQRNEYTRYSRDIQRRNGRVFVLTGTASVFRSRALRTVAELRGTELPGRHGDVYDTAALTEDNEMTLALKSLGAIMVSPPECRVETEVMTTLGALWKQRLRWQRGALENLGAYGVTPQTTRYWFQQLALGYGSVALFSYFFLMAILVLALNQWVWFPFWVGVGLLFALERVVTVRRGSFAGKVLAALVLPELVDATFLNVVFLKGVLDILRSKQAEWTHVSATGQVVNNKELA